MAKQTTTIELESSRDLMKVLAGDATLTVRFHTQPIGLLKQHWDAAIVSCAVKGDDRKIPEEEMISLVSTALRRKLLKGGELVVYLADDFRFERRGASK